MNNGIEYKLTGEPQRGRINRYHGNLAPLHLGQGAKHIDVKMLKKADRANVKMLSNGDYDSRFAIGFEIEKNAFHRGAVVEHELILGYETDSSCGYEAVTHILPLLPSCKWRSKIYNMMHCARRIIEDEYSPSNSKCGGHITISVEGKTGYEVQQAIRKNCGIVYALFRHRLTNGYCRSDIFMDAEDAQGLYTHNPRKYRVTKVFDDRLEFRLPNRFQSVKQMMRRYELMYEILDYSFNKPNGSHAHFLKKITPIIVSMYEGDMDKVNMIMSLAKSFRTMLVTKKINADVKQWINPNDDVYLIDYHI